MRKPATLAAVFAVILVTTLPGPAYAQRRRQQGQSLPQPSVQSIAPVGVQAGGTVDVTVRGNDLEGVNTLWFDHPGLRAFHLKGTTFRVVCATGTPVGHHDVRAVGTYGVSNPRTLVVGDRPVVAETEPNNAPEKANAVAVNSVVCGEAGAATDVDCFAFEAKKGQRLLLDLEGERVDSKLDATLRLLDPQGRELAESRDAIGADPFLDVTVPADGRYVVKVHDVIYRGSNEHPYRLTITDGPHLDAVVPAVARPGEETTFTLYGRNLGGEPAPGVLVDGQPLEKTAVTITPPASCEAEADCPTRGFVLSPGANRRGFEYTLTTPAGTSNPVFIALANDPVVVEREPNDDGKHAQEVNAPCEISGGFGAPGDLDVYRFRAKKGDIFWIEASAERIGSAADPTFTVQKVNDKGEAQDLATGDDTPERGDPTRFPTITVDAAVRWAAPDDGTYQVSISDLYASQRGDVRLAYRLSLRPERPDFALFLLPDSQNQPDALTLHAGGRAMAFVLAVRSDGFNGPIRVEAVDLPPGVRCEPVVIGPNQSSAPVVFEAAEGAKPALGAARLVGRARYGDRKDELRYVPGATPLGPDVSHPAVGAGIVWASGPPQPGQQGQNGPLAASRLTRGFVVNLIDEAPLTLTATPRGRYTTPGGRLALDLNVTRRAGFAGAVAVTLANPLPGLANPPAVNVAAGATAGTYAVTVPRQMAPGEYTFVLQGSGPYPFSKDPKAKTKPNVNLGEPSNPVTLVVRPAPATVGVKGGGTVKAGGSLAVEVTVTPKDAPAGPVTVALDAPSALKLKAEPVQAEPGKPVKIVVSAAADSPPGAAAGVAVRVTVPVRGEPVDVDEPVALTIAK
jgi:hypothetical protein